MAVTLTLPMPGGGFLGRLFRRMACASGLETERGALERRFHAMLASHDPMIRRICFGYARTAAELDDLHQDALLNIWQALPRFRGESAERTWVYRIVLNTCVSTLRSRLREPQREGLQELYLEVIDESEERRRLVAELHEAIAQLPPLDKAIVLAWLDEFSYDEIAQMTGLPRNTVATRLRRAKLRLALIG